MEKEKRAALAAIDEKEALLTGISNSIWGFAELSLQEYNSAALLCRAAEQEGFHVQKGVSGIETAFTASFGHGKPVIGILAEYDALAGLSQEGGAAKAFMARDKLWYGLDAALTWHPDDCNEAATGTSNACIQVQYLFHGVAAHAAGSPEKGRSALDAVTLMNLGTEFLREHMDGKSRIHYTVTNGGGCSPNVVPAEASVLYMVRSDRVKKALELKRRMDDIAKGAALMTGTTYTRKFIDGLSETIPNHALEALLHKNLTEIGAPEYTPEELSFADKLAATYDAAGFVPGCGSDTDPVQAEKVKSLQSSAGHSMNDFVLPLYTGSVFCPGSTDVGDVSWQCPTAQLHIAAWPNGCPGHSWQNVSCGCSSIGRKAVMQASKILCAAAVDLLTEPDVLAAAKAEFGKRTADGYSCPIPPDAVPTIPEL